MRLVDSRSLISYASVVSVFAVLVLAGMTVFPSAVLSNDTTSDEKEENNTFLRRVKQKKKEIREQLKKDSSWELSPRKRRLPGKTRHALNLIQELRCAECLDLLVAHIDAEQMVYVPGTGRVSEFPVCNTIMRIGMPAIPWLVKSLKTLSPQKEALKRRLASGTIVEILRNRQWRRSKQRKGRKANIELEKGSRFGAKMAKKLLELEIARTEDENERSRLQEALNSGVRERYLEESDAKER